MFSFFPVTLSSRSTILIVLYECISGVVISLLFYILFKLLVLMESSSISPSSFLKSSSDSLAFRAMDERCALYEEISWKHTPRCSFKNIYFWAWKIYNVLCMRDAPTMSSFWKMQSISADTPFGILVGSLVECKNKWWNTNGQTIWTTKLHHNL